MILHVIVWSTTLHVEWAACYVVQLSRKLLNIKLIGNIDPGLKINLYLLRKSHFALFSHSSFNKINVQTFVYTIWSEDEDDGQYLVNMLINPIRSGVGGLDSTTFSVFAKFLLIPLNKRVQKLFYF